MIDIKEIGFLAKVASKESSVATSVIKNEVLKIAADEIIRKSDEILKAIVHVYIRHHWIEKNSSRRTELPAWGLPAMSRRVWAVWRTVASPRHVRIVLYNPCSCCYSMLRSVDTWTGDLFRQPLADVDL